ncbi:MAG: sulfotransferase [Candidatus Thiodiazotropha endolucinida]|nr:sulfotransferase [Candidatus Thiodiazotropha taylori]MCG8096269.1 sulfotransferase [Candidatus Thiodiazotropha endolucinida]MCW4315073.1 sulfotransferase [Candidatus Thiodiazotropha taylori]
MIAQLDSEYNKNGFKKILRRLVSYGFFEGRPHTTKGQWFNPVVFSLLKLINFVPGTSTLHKPIFITGLGRSGTTILGVILSLHRDVGFLNEPKAIWRLVDPQHDINGDYVSTNGKFKLSSKDVTENATLTANRIFSRYLKLVNSSRLVDKYPELIFRVDYILKLFPDAKILFLTRNGCDAIHSIDLWSRRLGIQKNGVIEDWWGRDDVKWSYLRDQIINIDDTYAEIRSVATKDLDHVNRAALEWIITMREGLKQYSQYPNSVYQFKYEDLLIYKSDVISQILECCELSRDNTVTTYADSMLYTNSQKPYPLLNKEIDILFRKTMHSLKYEA